MFILSQIDIHAKKKKSVFFLSLPVTHSKMLFDNPEEDANYNPLPEERPGGFAWGEGQRLGG